MTLDKTPIAIYARDWAYTEGACDSRSHKFEPVCAWICGWLVEENEDCLVITMQWFDDNGVRATLAVPSVCILERCEFQILQNVVQK